MNCGVIPIVFRETTIIAMFRGEVLDKKWSTLRIPMWSLTVVIAEPGDD